VKNFYKPELRNFTAKNRQASYGSNYHGSIGRSMSEVLVRFCGEAPIAKRLLSAVWNGITERVNHQTPGMTGLAGEA